MISSVLCCHCAPSENFDWIKDLSPVLVVVIGGLFAVFKMKSNAVSSVRIKWIIEFRETLSEYLIEIDKGLLLYYNFNVESERADKSAEDEYKYFDDLLRESYYSYTNSIHASGRLSYKLTLLIDSANLSQGKFLDVLADINVIVSGLV